MRYTSFTRISASAIVAGCENGEAAAHMPAAPRPTRESSGPEAEYLFAPDAAAGHVDAGAAVFEHGHLQRPAPVGGQRTGRPDDGDDGGDR
jgi:hypothetical protein